MLSEPHWLIMIFPLLCLVFYFKPESKVILFLRISLILVLCLALSAPIVKIKGQEGIVVVVADRSSSMPPEIDNRIQETTGILLENMPVNSRLGLVSFNEKARIEFSPTKNEISALSELQNPDASNMGDGIDLALSLIPEGISGRIILLSDGLWNGMNPQTAALNAVNRNIPIDYRVISRKIISDLAVSYLNVPKFLEPNEPFILRAGIISPLEQDAEIELLNGDKRIFKKSCHLKQGNNELSFNLFAPPSSVARFVFKAFASKDDSILNNNVAQATSLVKGKKPILVINETSESSIKKLLDKNGITAELKKPRDFSWSADDLIGYSAVVLENVPANSIGFSGMHSLAAWVKHMGGGLLVTGGKNSYGDGGYHKSPLEEALPVSLEMRSEKRKMNIAIAVVLDRSGSMSMSAGGRTKMELADLAAVSSLDLLMPTDEFAVFAVDTSPHLIVPLQKASSKDALRNKVLSIRSQGGGIYVYEGLKAAVDVLEAAESSTRHIILFSDASDSEKPGEYWNLLDYANSVGITCSVIGLGKETDCDGEILKKVAEAGKGRCYFTNEAEDLPRLFSQDTFIAAKSTFAEGNCDIESSIGITSISNKNIDFKSSIDAFNICYIKPEATQAITAIDEDKSPILSFWQYGLGKVACYTGVMSKEKGGAFLNTDIAVKVFSNLCEWIAYDDRSALGDVVVTQRVENGVWKVGLNLDPDRARDPFTQTPTIDIISSQDNEKPKYQTLTMTWENADLLSAEYNLKGNEILTSILKIDEKKNLRLPPASQIYSPEFLPQLKRNGSKEMKLLANMTGGRELIDLSSVWATMPMAYQDKNIANPLFYLALILFLLEIAERRLALISIILSVLRRSKNKSEDKVKVKIVEKEPVVDEGKTVTSVASMEIPQKVENKSDKDKSSEKESKGFYSILKEAKKKADRRM